MKAKMFFGFAGLFLAIIISFIFILKIKRSEIIDYDPSIDYKYTFKNSDTVNLKLINGKLTLPANLGNDKTAFLKVKIESTFFGSFYPPHIEMTSQSQGVIGFFEYGAAGFRYMNISSLLNFETKEIELKSIHSKILDSNIQLIYFSNSIQTDSKILVISPHPDDAEIAAYGLYSKFPNSFVLTITAGENGEMNYDELYTDSLSHYEKMGQIRTINSLSVPLMAGLSQNNVLNLGYHDGTIKEMHDSNPTSIFSQTLNADFSSSFRNFNISNLKDSLIGPSNWNSMVQNLEFVLKTYQPDIIVLPHPQMDSHSDHQFSTIGVIHALKNAGIKSGELFLYANHQLRSEFFPFGKQGGTISLPPNFNDDYYFQSIYSHNLTEEEQMGKVLALDAMNDLRPNTEWRFWDKLLELSFETFKVSLKGHENNYFKRAIRSNELFFVVPVNDLYNKKFLRELQFGKSIVPK
jgi:LmbE family N-acetylglucosaminyl deacetylase